MTPAEEKSRKAIAHILNAMKQNPYLAWYIGYGSEAFALLTEAAAELFERPLDEVQDRFRVPGKNPRD